MSSASSSDKPLYAPTREELHNKILPWLEKATNKARPVHHTSDEEYPEVFQSSTEASVASGFQPATSTNDADRDISTTNQQQLTTTALANLADAAASNEENGARPTSCPPEQRTQDAEADGEEGELAVENVKTRRARTL